MLIVKPFKCLHIALRRLVELTSKENHNCNYLSAINIWYQYLAIVEAKHKASNVEILIARYWLFNGMKFWSQSADNKQNVIQNHVNKYITMCFLYRNDKYCVEETIKSLFSKLLMAMQAETRSMTEKENHCLQ